MVSALGSLQISATLGECRQLAQLSNAAAEQNASASEGDSTARTRSEQGYGPRSLNVTCLIVAPVLLIRCHE